MSTHHVHGVACEQCGDATTETATVECPKCVACVCDDCHERELSWTRVGTSTEDHANA